MSSNSHFVPIAKLLSHGRSDHWPVSRSGPETFTWQDFASHIRSLAARITQLNGKNWCLFCESSYAFSVGLLALLETGRHALLPPNAQSATMEDFSHQADGLVSDCLPDFSGKPVLSPLEGKENLSFTFSEQDTQRRFLTLYTSGSTGERKAVPKTLANLDLEVAGLESFWGTKLEDSLVLSTVSHQHIYGLLFRILWPLASGHPFYDATISYPESFNSVAQLSPRIALVSSPAHLKRLPEGVDFSSFASKLKALFSSGGALDEQTAKHCSVRLGCPPIEIFGSTETGGVAWRMQTLQSDKNPQIWKAFSSVDLRLSQDQSTLQVRSPFVSLEPHAEWFSMGDVVSLLDENTFILHGRADSIVKLEEKRISLPLVQQKLQRHPFVDSAKVLLLERNADISTDLPKRSVLGAAVILSPSGRTALENQGRRTLADILRNHLKQYIEPVALPRQWRYLTSFPEDSQGKQPLELLRKLFEEKPTHPENYPIVHSLKRSSEHFFAELEVPRELHYLKGHYPSLPIVPGFIQIDWVMHFLGENFAQVASPFRVQHLKFHHVLPPEARFFLELTWNSQSRSATFELRGQQDKYSSGRIQFD